ncbi:MAG: hypothetical protein ACLFVQ_04015 [Chitinispirillaceae bacterium]
MSCRKMFGKTGLVLLVSCVVLFARENRGYGFLMLEEPVSPRISAMGTAGTALGGSGFQFYNPARMFFSQIPFVSIEFGQMPGGVQRGGIESSILISEYFLGMGIYSSAVDFQTRDEHGFGSSMANNTTSGSFNAGFMRDRYSLAVSFNAVQDRIGHYSTVHAFSMSGGLGFRAIPGKLDFGMSGFHGIGMSRGFLNSDSTWQKGRIPRWARAGAAWKDTVNSLPYTVALDAVYRDEDGSVTFPLGVEVNVLPSVAVRMGKRLGMETEVISLGVGLNIDNISFDAAFIPVVLVDDYDMKWNMAFTYSLGGGRSTKPQPKEASVPDTKAVDVAEEESAPEEAIEVVEEPVEKSDSSASVEEAGEEPGKSVGKGSENLGEPLESQEELVGDDSASGSKKAAVEDEDAQEGSEELEQTGSEQESDSDSADASGGSESVSEGKGEAPEETVVEEEGKQPSSESEKEGSEVQDDADTSEEGGVGEKRAGQTQDDESVSQDEMESSSGE